MKYIILVLSLLLIAAPRAYADCVSDCQASTYCGGSSWDCAHLLNDCYRGCNNSSSEPRTYPWGAIAYDKESGAYGLSERSTTEKNARRSAMKFCSKNGKKCEVVETFSNTCAAIAEDPKGHVGWAKDEEQKEAVKDAIEACNDKSDDENCELSVETCYPK